jgi:hypothetical protein
MKGLAATSAVGDRHLNDLAQGFMSRSLRTNRFDLVPSFERLYQSNHHNHHGTSVGLHDRLEELLVFEILKDG